MLCIPGTGEPGGLPSMESYRGKRLKRLSSSSSTLCFVAQLCLTLCDPMNCSPPGSSVHGASPGKNTGVGCRTLIQGIFPTQRSNAVLLHCRHIIYHLSQNSKNTGVGRLSLLQGIFRTQELNRSLLHCRWILYKLPGKPIYIYIYIYVYVYVYVYI